MIARLLGTCFWYINPFRARPGYERLGNYTNRLFVNFLVGQCRMLSMGVKGVGAEEIESPAALVFPPLHDVNGDHSAGTSARS